MKQRTVLLVVMFVLATTIIPARAADGPDRKNPESAAAGKVFEWTSGDGLVYHYRLPKGYREERGAGLTFILHGSNLDRRWGFANHSPKTFRPDDIVVSPDGTTPNGRSGFNFLGEAADLKKLRALQKELEAVFKINGVYLYGHSQGSFFAFLYAGAYPDAVQGVVGHASGVWGWTKQGKKGHHQAIVLMHGTQDPVVPFRQSAGGLESFRKARYPMVRLRSLEGWNHWPAEHNGPVPHTSQQLAWCEGMTTADPERMEWCFDFIASCKARERSDFAAVHTLACRIGESEQASAALKKRAAKAATAVNELAERHVKALAKAKPSKFGGKAWLGHLPMFLRTFAGVPACDAHAESLEKVLRKQKKESGKHLKKYRAALRKGDHGEAFEAGVAALDAGYLCQAVQERAFLDNLDRWAGDAKKLRIPKKSLKAHAGLGLPLRKALEAGGKDFDTINRKCGKL